MKKNSLYRRKSRIACVSFIFSTGKSGFRTGRNAALAQYPAADAIAFHDPDWSPDPNRYDRPAPNPMESIWQKIFGVSPAGAYAVLFGLLCGYPMGAKLTSDLYASRKISRREAQYLLTFTNHASPMFISSYLIHTCMNGQVSALEVFSLLLAPPSSPCCACACGFFVQAAGTLLASPRYTHQKRDIL